MTQIWQSASSCKHLFCNVLIILLERDGYAFFRFRVSKLGTCACVSMRAENIYIYISNERPGWKGCKRDTGALNHMARGTNPNRPREVVKKERDTNIFKIYIQIQYTCIYFPATIEVLVCHVWWGGWSVCVCVRCFFGDPWSSVV